MFWALLQILLVFGLMGFGIYYFAKKMKENKFTQTGEKGKIQVLDGVNLSYQTSTYLLNVDQQPVFVVVGPNGTTTTLLKEKRFEELLTQGIEERYETESEEEYENE